MLAGCKNTANESVEKVESALSAEEEKEDTDPQEDEKERDQAAVEISADEESSAEMEENEEVKFHDEIFEMYVRRQMGKGPEDVIWKSEAESLKELKIDQYFACSANDYVLLRGGLSIRMSLQDLEKLAGLEYLTIENTPSDFLYDMGAIKKCRKLKELSINYFLDESQYTENSSWKCTAPVQLGSGWGKRFLLDLLESLPELEKFDPGNQLPDILLEEIDGMDTLNHIQIKTYDEYIARPETDLSDVYAENIQAIDKNSRYLKVRTRDETVIEYIKGMPQLEYLDLVWTENSSYFDLDFLENLTQLRYLSINSRSDYDDLSVLTNLQELKHLSLLGSEKNGDYAYTEFDFESLRLLTGLETLRLPYQYYPESFDFLGSFDNLQVLEIAAGTNGVIWDSAVNENLKNLRKLVVYQGKNVISDTFIQLPALEMAIFSGGEWFGLDFQGCPEARALIVELDENETSVDYSGLKEAGKLETFILTGRPLKTVNASIFSELNELKFLSLLSSDLSAAQEFIPLVNDNFDNLMLSYICVSNAGKMALRGSMEKAISEIDGYKSLIKKGIYDGLFTSTFVSGHSEGIEMNKIRYGIEYN